MDTIFYEQNKNFSGLRPVKFTEVSYGIWSDMTHVATHIDISPTGFNSDEKHFLIKKEAQ